MLSPPVARGRDGTETLIRVNRRRWVPSPRGRSQEPAGLVRARANASRVGPLGAYVFRQAHLASPSQAFWAFSFFGIRTGLQSGPAPRLELPTGRGGPRLWPLRDETVYFLTVPLSLSDESSALEARLRLCARRVCRNPLCSAGLTKTLRNLGGAFLKLKSTS